MSTGTRCTRRFSDTPKKSTSTESGPARKTGGSSAGTQARGANGSAKTQAKMSLKKSELEELNQTLCQALRRATGENQKLCAQNARLQEALERVCAALRKQREQILRHRMRYQKLTDYVRRLHAWAAASRKGKGSGT